MKSRIQDRKIRKSLGTLDDNLYFLTSEPDNEDLEFISGVTDRLDRLLRRLSRWSRLYNKEINPKNIQQTLHED